MIPDSVTALVSFLLLLAPGSLWQLQKARHEPSVKETTLVEVSRVVISSFIATAVAVAVLVPPVWLPLYKRAEARGAAAFDSPTSAVPYVGAVIATSLVACGLVLIAAAFKWPIKPAITPGRQWNHAFVLRNKTGVAPYLTVVLLDDTVWRGELVGFDTDPEDDQRGLTLGPPLRRKRPDEHAYVEKGAGGGGAVILPEAQIKSIQVDYPRTDPPTRP